MKIFYYLGCIVGHINGIFNVTKMYIKILYIRIKDQIILKKIEKLKTRMNDLKSKS